MFCLAIDTGLSFVRSPEPIVAPPGDEVMFECSLNIPWESVRWRHNSEYLPREHLAPTTSRQTTTYRQNTSYRLVKVVDQEQAGDYQVLFFYVSVCTCAENKKFKHLFNDLCLT